VVDPLELGQCIEHVTDRTVERCLYGLIPLLFIVHVGVVVAEPSVWTGVAVQGSLRCYFRRERQGFRADWPITATSGVAAVVLHGKEDKVSFGMDTPMLADAR
jgi:hypothetical protein